MIYELIPESLQHNPCWVYFYKATEYVWNTNVTSKIPDITQPLDVFAEDASREDILLRANRIGWAFADNFSANWEDDDRAKRFLKRFIESWIPYCRNHAGINQALADYMGYLLGMEIRIVQLWSNDSDEWDTKPLAKLHRMDTVKLPNDYSVKQANEDPFYDPSYNKTFNLKSITELNNKNPGWKTIDQDPINGWYPTSQFDVYVDLDQVPKSDLQEKSAEEIIASLFYELADINQVLRAIVYSYAFTKIVRIASGASIVNRIGEYTPPTDPVEPIPSLTYYMSSIQRFDPTYWRVDGPQTASFSISNYMNGFEVAFESRLKSDFVGIVWDSKDTKDHQYLRYETNYDYSGLVWEFDISLSATMPALNDPQASPTLTVHYVDEQGRKGIAYVALFNYADNPSGRTAHITINFDTVKGGFNATTDFNVRYIEKMFLGGYVSEYENAAVPLAQTTSGFVRVTNIVLAGAVSATTLPLYRVNIQDHNIGMCTSYDDHYDLNPKRIVNNLKALGYSGFINHYCGMSHYPVMDWDFTNNRFYIPDTLVDGRDVVNVPTKKWHQAYANALQAEGFEPVFSVSWELYSQAAREEWCQRDWDSNLGRTGYTPPSYFASLCNPNAIAYLHKAYKEFADILVAASCPVNMQIGEPWWWFNVDSLKPCVYDYPTKLAFNADTGLFAPDLGTIFEAVDKTDPTSQAFKDWLRNKLGQTCQDIRTMIKAEYGSSAKVCPLIFFPSIRTHQESLATYINYPQEHYAAPNFDYVMTEAYDWIIEQPPRLDLSHQAVNEIPIGELGYAPNNVAYLSGFVPDAAIAYIYKFDYTKPYRLPIWRRIFGDIKNNENVGVMKQLVWAYPQVMYDSLTIDGRYDGFFSNLQYNTPIQINTPYPEDIRGEDLSPWQPDPILRPVGITAVLHPNYDITINFNVENEVAGATYEVQILNQTGMYSLWTKFTDTHSATITSQELSDRGLGTLLKVLVVPSVGEMSTIIDIEAVAE